MRCCSVVWVRRNSKTSCEWFRKTFHFDTTRPKAWPFSPAKQQIDTVLQVVIFYFPQTNLNPSSFQNSPKFPQKLTWAHGYQQYIRCVTTIEIPRKSWTRDIHMTGAPDGFGHSWNSDETLFWEDVPYSIVQRFLDIRWTQSCAYRMTDWIGVVTSWTMGSFVDYMGNHIWVRVDAC